MAPMSNAERQRKYREKIKQNAEKYEEKKKKHREYMKAARRPIAELTEKEKEKKRREWRLAKKKQKERGVTKPKNKNRTYISEKTVEKLIGEVRKRPCLWNPKDPNYTHRMYQIKVWKEIAGIVGLRVDIAKVKWKYMRDLFKRELRKFKVTSVDNYLGRWRYFDSLKFLFKPGEYTFPEENEKKISREEDEIDQTDDEEDKSNNDDNKREVYEEPEIEIANFETNRCNEEDFDLMFLKSLWPYFSQLDPMRKLTMRGRIQDLLMNEIAAQQTSTRNNNYNNGRDNLK